MFLSSALIFANITPLNVLMSEPLNPDQKIFPKAPGIYSEQWLVNPTLTSPIEPPWFKSTGGDDPSDIDLSASSNQADLKVIGKIGSCSVAGVPSGTQWTAVSNPEFPVLPNVDFGFDAGGAFARHTWNENTDQTGNTPSVHFKQNVTMPVNMNDYEITSASITCIVNASVNANLETPGDGVGQFDVGDYVRFYVTLSDLNEVKKYEVAYNKTRDLGQSTPPILTMSNVYLITVPEEVLIFYLTSILGSDNYNFTITLGIFIYCEDNNVAYDTDTWTWLRITYFNLTFSYEKKINRNTHMAWNQIGNKLPAINITQEILQVDAATLYFKYKIDQNWSPSSPNSEIRILMNNITYPETIKLSKANSTFQEGKPGGFDVTSFITKDVNISVGVQVYLADNFVLSSNTTISIDDIYLWINYTIFAIPPPQPPSLNVNANSSTPFTNQWTNIVVSCQSGAANVDHVWYYNPLTGANVTLDINFAGLRVYNLYFMNETAGSHRFKFWANSTVGGATYEDIIIIWVKPQSPIVNMATNSSSPYVNQWIQFTIACQSGSANVSRLWYFNPFTSTNVTLDSDFEGANIYLLNFTSSTAGPREFKFWANSTLGEDAFQAITIVWVTPQPPVLTVLANTTSPYVNFGAQLTVSCQSGSGNVDHVWYYNPLDTSNHTLATDFSGTQNFYLNFTSASAGAYQFKFWANSTFGITVFQAITVVWVTPQSPVLTVNANTTNPYIHYGTQITVSCQSGSANVDHVWYYNPFDTSNHTLATDFSGSQMFRLNFSNAIAGAYQFKFWANSTIGSGAYQTITVVWVIPQPPALSVNANITNPYVNRGTQLTVTCQSGAGNVDHLWYRNPFDSTNYTLATDFSGIQTFYLNFSSATAVPYQFKFWANSTFGAEIYQSITVVWVAPQSTILTVYANTTTPYVNEWTRFTVTCQSGSGNVDHLWYYNPIDMNNHTLATDYFGVQTFYLNFTRSSLGSYEFKFWANSTEGGEVYQAITVFWITPQAPILTTTVNTTIPYVNHGTQIKVTCQSGSGPVNTLWYYNPLDLTNHTLATDYTGVQSFYLNFTSASAGSYQFKFWANSTGAGEVYQSILVIWIIAQPPLMTLTANTTIPYLNQGSQIQVTCQSGSGNVAYLWYYNPLDMGNHTLATDFSGILTFRLNFTSVIAGSYKFQFWANSTLDVGSYQFISVVWVIPQPPILTITANTTIPFITEWTTITVSCQSGSGNVDHLWYLNPFDSTNYTIATDYSGVQSFQLNFTTSIAGTYQFKFWANSTLGVISYQSFSIVWVTPQPPILTVTANTTIPFITEWTTITVSCQSGSGNVDHLWYLNPFDSTNYTIATDFSGVRIFYLNFTRSSAGSYNFKFWTNSTFGIKVYNYITVVWVTPQSPILTVLANTTIPYINQGSQIQVSCQSGSRNVAYLWYYNPLDMSNHTLATDFSGVHISYLNFTTAIAGNYQFKFWANSTFGLEVFQSITVVWVTPQPPILSVFANITNPYTNQWTQLTVTCQSGSGPVDRLWYLNPFDLKNWSLATSFSGLQIIYVNFTTGTAGPYEFKFWANSSAGLTVYNHITVVWIPPQPPALTVYANITNPYINQGTKLTVTCQTGTDTVDRLWYYNPLDLDNHTLDTSFTGLRIFYLNFTSATAGPYEFKFWANSTLGAEISTSLTVVWINPLPPTLTITTNTTGPFTTQWTQLRVRCQSGSGDVDLLWYSNPFDSTNHTLAMSFSGIQIINLNFSSAIAGPYEFKFWANSTLGAEAFTSITIVWVTPLPPTLTVGVNVTSPYINKWVQLTITCKNGSGTMDQLWYLDPVDLTNHTLATSFTGTTILYLNFTSANVGPREFKFWANSSFGLEVFAYTTVVWLEPPKPNFMWLTWVLVGALAVVAAIIASYELYFKVPKTIRMIRQTKSAIQKGKPTKPLDVTPREKMVDDTFNKKLNMQKLPTPPKQEAAHVMKKLK